MARITITITESISRTYMVSADELEDLDLPTDRDELKALDEEHLAVSLIDSDLEDRYEVSEREIEIEPAAPSGA